MSENYDNIKFNEDEERIINKTVDSYFESIRRQRIEDEIQNRIDERRSQYNQGNNY